MHCNNIYIANFKFLFMADVLFISSIVLSILVFIFILFLFIVVIISIFKKENFENFQPKVSVIIPAYNESKTIGLCLNSVLNQDYNNEVEIIVVDDGSSDNTLKILKKYKKVKVVKQKHLGKSKALNNGISKAKNDFILVIDADTIIKKDFIREIIKPFSDKKVGATTGIIKLKNNKGILPMFQNVEYSFYNLIRHSFSSLFKNSVWFLGALACYRKDAIKKVGLFKTDSLTEDIDLAMEINKAGYENISVGNAYGFTHVPANLKSLYKQRSRWWIGALQALFKNKRAGCIRSDNRQTRSHFLENINAKLPSQNGEKAQKKNKSRQSFGKIFEINRLSHDNDRIPGFNQCFKVRIEKHLPGCFFYSNDNKVKILPDFGVFQGDMGILGTFGNKKFFDLNGLAFS